MLKINGGAVNKVGNTIKRATRSQRVMMAEYSRQGWLILSIRESSGVLFVHLWKDARPSHVAVEPDGRSYRTDSTGVELGL